MYWVKKTLPILLPHRATAGESYNTQVDMGEQVQKQMQGWTGMIKKMMWHKTKLRM
jgi:sulfopyruvate decarboxylase TPP-binding subunit